MEGWKLLAIGALGWRLDTADNRFRVQCPDRSVRHPGIGCSICETYIYQIYYVCQSFCHRSGEDCPEPLSVNASHCQDWSSTVNLRPSMCALHNGNYIISMIALIADSAHQVLAWYTSSHAAVVYHWNTTINSIYRIRIQSPTVIRILVVWLQPKDRFTLPTNVGKVSSKFRVF